MSKNPKKYFGKSRLCFPRLSHAVPAVLSLLAYTALTSPGNAQEALQAGEAYATRFSGTVEFTLDDGTKYSTLDQNGLVGSVIDVRAPGFPADGRHWRDEPQRLPLTAIEVGQVFGVAIDNARPANIYLTATSAFGLHRFDDNSDWLPGQWGPGAGPGTIYKLDGANGYFPQAFAEITLAGRPNSGAALGNIAYDATNRQLLVTDLETGMIHRISAATGDDLGQYDHGVDGRSSFYDATTGGQAVLPSIAFDPTSEAQIVGCTDAGGAPADFSTTPGCWNFADFRRRVWGVAVRTDPQTGQTRVFYSVWGSEGFGNPKWAGAGKDKRSSVWSVGLNQDGSFAVGDTRREFLVPPFGAGNKVARAVTDIAVSPEGVMLVAERGGVRNLGLTKPEPFATPQSSRVLRYRLRDNGDWTLDDRYDVGFADRQNVGKPYIRAGAAGGVDFGYGYKADGTIDLNAPYANVWMTGDKLCSPDGACVDPASGARTDFDQVHGLQGTPEVAATDRLPPAAMQAYPAVGDPYPADGPLASYMIDLDQNITPAGTLDPDEAVKNDAVKIGDVEIYRAGGYAVPGVPGGYGIPGGFDIEIDKTGPQACLPGDSCTFKIRFTNNGPDVYIGPLQFWDTMDPPGAVLQSVAPPDWTCSELGGGILCLRDPLKLAPGEWVELEITVGIPAGFIEPAINNCVAISWLYGADGSLNIEAVQTALVLLGYDPGPIDGVLGAKTSDALLNFQIDNGLPQTGNADALTLSALFPEFAGVGVDQVPANDRACYTVFIPQPQHNKLKTHLKFGSPPPIHTKLKTHLKTGSPPPVHNKLKTHLKTGSPPPVHTKLKTHLKTGTLKPVHTKLKTHLKTGSPPPVHTKLKTHLKTGTLKPVHTKLKTHLKTGSPPPVHTKLQTHMKTGTLKPVHTKLKTHLKTGSPTPVHTKLQTHMKTGTLKPVHTKLKTHLKTGSPTPVHTKLQTHMKTGTLKPVHTKLKTHLKTGSPTPIHTKLKTHNKTGTIVGPIHNKALTHAKTGSLRTPPFHNKLLSPSVKPVPVHTKARTHAKTGSKIIKKLPVFKKPLVIIKRPPAVKKPIVIIKKRPVHTKVQTHAKTGSKIIQVLPMIKKPLVIKKPLIILKQPQLRIITP